MSRLARESSWHLLAFVIVVAGLSVLAPVTWWHAARAEGGEETDAARHGEYGREPALRPEEYDPLVLTLKARRDHLTTHSLIRLRSQSSRRCGRRSPMTSRSILR